MTKIGRNDPCPCGSGKKYKKCCLLKIEQAKRQIKNTTNNMRKVSTNKPASNLPAVRNSTTPPRETFWREEEVEALDTNCIIKKLNQFGVMVKKKDFIDSVKQNDSAGEIVKKWRKMYHIMANGLDDDFFWHAAKVLWKRLSPDEINSEQIVDMIEHSDDCDEELKIWDIIKDRYGPRSKSIENVDEMFGDCISLSSWSQDLALKLLQSAEKAQSLYTKLQAYCEEFLLLFPESDEETLVWMMLHIAESYYGQGLEEKGNAIFQQITDEFPDDPWNYLRWGDMYWFRRLHDKIPLDTEKAISIYTVALSRIIGTDGRMELLDRLKDLQQWNENETS